MSWFIIFWLLWAAVIVLASLVLTDDWKTRPVKLAWLVAMAAIWPLLLLMLAVFMLADGIEWVMTRLIARLMGRRQ